MCIPEFCCTTSSSSNIMIDFFVHACICFLLLKKRLKNSLKQQLQFANTNFENKLPCFDCYKYSKDSSQFKSHASTNIYARLNRGSICSNDNSDKHCYQNNIMVHLKIPLELVAMQLAAKHFHF